MLSRQKIARSVLRNNTARQITAQKFNHARNVLHSVVLDIRHSDTELINSIVQYSDSVQYHLSHLINTMTNYSVFSSTYEVINLLGNNHQYHINSWEYIRLEIDRDTSLAQKLIETQIGTPHRSGYWSNLNIVFNGMVIRLKECNSTECIRDVLNEKNEYLQEAVQFLEHIDISIAATEETYTRLAKKIGQSLNISIP